MDASGAPADRLVICAEPGCGAVQLDRRQWRSDWGRVLWWDLAGPGQVLEAETTSGRRRAVGGRA